MALPPLRLGARKFLEIAQVEHRSGADYFCASGLRYGMTEAITASMFIKSGEGMTRRYFTGSSEVT